MDGLKVHGKYSSNPFKSQTRRSHNIHPSFPGRVFGSVVELRGRAAASV